MLGAVDVTPAPCATISGLILPSVAGPRLLNPDKDPLSTEQRDFGIGAQILRDLNVGKIKLISSHDKKRIGLIGYGLEIVEQIELK